MQKTGAEILIDELKLNGVSTIFGYPGGSILSVYDAMQKDGEIVHILSVDERGAINMADGFARSLGKTGVCLATSGPGATNLVTGIANAFMDSVPMVVITGNVPVESLGHDSFQEVDTTGITMPITKYNYIVKDVNNLSRIVNDAFYLASHGRKGPVLIDIPSNIFDERCEYEHTETIFDNDKAYCERDILEAAKIINDAERPLIYVGGGVTSSGTENLCMKLAEKLAAPIAVSFMGIGAIPSDNKYYIGVGSSLNKNAKMILKQCDVFISLGARFSNKATEKSLYGKKVKLVHLDIDKAEIGKIHRAEGAVEGDLAVTLPILFEKVKRKNTEWLNLVTNQISNSNSAISTSEEYIKCLNLFFGKQQIVTTDVGQHQLWVANYYDFDCPRRFLSSCGLGAMGYGLGAAIGAYYATGNRILTITGDGSFNMSFNELLTIKKYNIPIVIAIMNNSSLGMIREAQRKKYNGRFVDCDLDEGVDYRKIGEAYGINTFVAKTPSELKNILSVLPYDLPSIIDCRISKNEKSLI